MSMSLSNAHFVFHTFRSAYFFQTKPVTSMCSDCLKRNQRQKRNSFHPRRQLTTASAYRPQTLDVQPPPRSAGILETSIAGTKTVVEGTRSAASKGYGIALPESGTPPKLSMSEGEAQKPQSTAQMLAEGSVATAPASSLSNKPRRSKLKARKAAMSLTPAAVSQLRELLSQPEPKLIRVGVKNRGCSGLAYHLEYVEKPGTFDEAVDQDGVKVLIDSKALFSIIGSEMDWVEDKLSRRFVFKNPNITEQCGCGESFSIS